MKSPTSRAVRSAPLVAACVLAVDQATKAAAPLLAPLGPHLVYPASNAELSLGTVDTARWLEVAAMTVVLAALVALAPLLRHRARVPAWALSSTLAGAASNLADRALLGAVRDWLVLGPIVVNVADLAVLLGLTRVLYTLASASPPGRAQKAGGRPRRRLPKAPTTGAVSSTMEGRRRSWTSGSIRPAGVGSAPGDDSL
jgi:lipoprotein signal peptidase